MINLIAKLLLEIYINSIAPLVIIVILAIFAVICVVAYKVSYLSKKDRNTSEDEFPFVDMNYEYLAQQKSEQKSEHKSEQKKKEVFSKKVATTSATKADHNHDILGTKEFYEPYVGSLGEGKDEGCEELEGVRFLTETVNSVSEEEGENDDELRKVAIMIVMGEAIGEPRSKVIYGRHNH